MKELLLEFGSNLDFLKQENYQLMEYIKKNYINNGETQLIDENDNSGQYFNMGFSRGIITFPKHNCSCFLFKPNEIIKYYHRLSGFNGLEFKKYNNFLIGVIDFYRKTFFKDKIQIYNKKERYNSNKRNIRNILNSMGGVKESDVFVENFDLEGENFKSEGIRFLNFQTIDLYTPDGSTIIFNSKHVITDFKKELIETIFSFLSYILLMVYAHGKNNNFSFEHHVIYSASINLFNLNEQLISITNKECIQYRQNLINEILSKYNIPK